MRRNEINTVECSIARALFADRHSNIAGCRDGRFDQCMFPPILRN